MKNETTAFHSPEQRSLDACLRSLKARWQEYGTHGNFEHFVEFTLALDNLTEQLNSLKLPGLLRQCEGLENAALALFGDEQSHPVSVQDAAALERQIDTLLHTIENAMAPQPGAEEEHRRHPSSLPHAGAEWAKPRAIWLIAEESHAWVPGLAEQLAFNGCKRRCQHNKTTTCNPCRTF